MVYADVFLFVCNSCFLLLSNTQNDKIPITFSLQLDDGGVVSVIVVASSICSILHNLSYFLYLKSQYNAFLKRSGLLSLRSIYKQFNIFGMQRRIVKTF